MIGAHILNDLKHLKVNCQELRARGANMIQLFISPVIAKSNEFKKFIKDNSFGLVVHASFTINLAKDWDEYSPHILQFIHEIHLADKLGAKFIVVHMGKQMALEKAEAYNNMYSSIVHIYTQTKDTKIKILLETSTGQGSELCFNIEDFAYFFNKINRNKLIANKFYVCLDTAHVFAAGYDLTSASAIDKYLVMWDKLIGLDNIQLIHLNDAKRELGSQVDRHENLGKGFIGLDNLLYLAKFFKERKVGLILETPETYLMDDISSLVKL